MASDRQFALPNIKGLKPNKNTFLYEIGFVDRDRITVVAKLIYAIQSATLFVTARLLDSHSHNPFYRYQFNMSWRAIGLNLCCATVRGTQDIV